MIPWYSPLSYPGLIYNFCSGQPGSIFEAKLNILFSKLQITHSIMYQSYKAGQAQITRFRNYIVNIYEYESLIICENLRNLRMGYRNYDKKIYFSNDIPA